HDAVRKQEGHDALARLRFRPTRRGECSAPRPPVLILVILSRQHLWRCARTMNWLWCGAESRWEQNTRIPFGALCPILRLAPIADCCAFWRALSFPLERFVTLD